MHTKLPVDPKYCKSFNHPNGDGIILLFPQKDILVIDIETQVSWSGHLLPQAQAIGIGRDSKGNIVAIHISEGTKV